jgi:hypothetical protein
MLALLFSKSSSLVSQPSRLPTYEILKLLSRATCPGAPDAQRVVAVVGDGAQAYMCTPGT